MQSDDEKNKVSSSNRNDLNIVDNLDKNNQPKMNLPLPWGLNESNNKHVSSVINSVVVNGNRDMQDVLLPPVQSAGVPPELSEK